MDQRIAKIYEISNIDPDDLSLARVTLDKSKGHIVVHAEKRGEIDQAALLTWESGMTRVLESYQVEFEYADANEYLRFGALEGGAVAEITPEDEVSFDLPEDRILYGEDFEEAKKVLTPSEVKSGKQLIHVKGRAISHECREPKAFGNNLGKYRVRFNLVDGNGSVWCNVSFDDAFDAKQLDAWLGVTMKKGLDLLVSGRARRYKESDIYLSSNTVKAVSRTLRMDASEEKRVELHLHTRMSAKDALTNMTEAFNTAKRWGHKAIAVTDHGVVQAFPEAYKAQGATGVKAIFGVEGYLVPDTVPMKMGGECVVFDIETTGLKAESCEIIEIGAVKYRDGVEIDSFHSFIDDGVVIPPRITELTGITTETLVGAPRSREVLTRFHAFTRGCLLVAHNAAFDVGFIRLHGERFSLDFDNPYADTLMLSRYLVHDEVINHKLDTLCEYFNIDMGSHHRAVDDARSCASIFFILTDMLKAAGETELPVVTPKLSAPMVKGKRAPVYHVIILVRTQKGMRDLYKIISFSHLDHFHTKPQIPRSMLSVFRKELIIGSACCAGELYKAILNGASDTESESIASFYDFLEIQPIINNSFLVREGAVKDDDALRDVNRRIFELGHKLGKPVAATGDVHFLEPEDAIFRKILLYKEGYSDAEYQPTLYLKTTAEMLEEFSYLGEAAAHEVIIDVPNAIADSCDTLKAFPDGTHAPKIPNAEQELSDRSYKKAHEIYGDPLPDVVKARLERELSSIIGNGFASLYLMAQRLVQKSLSDGYIVGSRGSVGSSFVATMAGISEVNALAPHYNCPNCHFTDFDVDRTLYQTGPDMPDRDCPNCGTKLRKMGFDIPFEVFLGFNGDKTPDIDLNFSGEYQPVAHKYVEEMFGRGHAFRAGTISGIADKKAFEYVLSYGDAVHMQLSSSEVERLKIGVTNVKLTTGQHPGGIVIVPKEDEIYDYTPVQHPADRVGGDTITTHFDFHALDDRLVKLDILGHDDPTALRMLEDLTGVSPHDVPIGDPETLSLFSSAEQLGIDLSALDGCTVGTIGVPEFGTGFVRQVLEMTRPKTMEELVRIAGLTHGTDVWLNNAEPLVRNGTAKLSEVICARDDIMNYLISKGMEPSLSFKIMEKVRKGKGITAEWEQAMADCAVPSWFVGSCKKIKYLFPRGHAVAYVMMAFSVAYFKRHYPAEFYAVYYTVRADAFDITQAEGGPERILQNIIKLSGPEATAKDKDVVTILEVVYEMNLRGIELLPVDIYKSEALRFTVENGAIRPPFNAVPGLGGNAALSIAEKRGGGRFSSIEDFAKVTGANTGVISALEASGCFLDLPKKNQISLFDMF